MYDGCLVGMMEDVEIWYGWKSGSGRLLSACSFEGWIGALCGCSFEDWWVVLCGSGGVSLCGSVKK